MELDFNDLTKAQRKAVRWLWRQRGWIIVPPLQADVYEMHGSTRSKSREPLQSLVWRSTFKALFHRGWLVMDGRGAWRLSPAANVALEQALIETDGFTKGEAACR